ncbi:MAG: metal ABC transporter permease [Thiotrichaceae bacterium]|nr:metal ABC transporter permease [Thiotrichaceae bacterium]
MDDFILRALFAGILVAILCGALGVFVVWRRMAYFGDTVSHASLLGVSLGITLGITTHLSVLAVAIGIALLMIVLQAKQRVSNDTLLGILAHSALSLSLVIISLTKGVQINLEAWLFGDILASSNQDIMTLCITTVIILIALRFIWKPLLSLTVNENLARVEGVNVTLVSSIFTILIAVTIAIGIKVIGALLISSLLIIPAAAARYLVCSPIRMVFVSMVIGIFAVCAGMTSSFFFDTPTGPAIILSASFIFSLLFIYNSFKESNS